MFANILFSLIIIGSVFSQGVNSCNTAGPSNSLASLFAEPPSQNGICFMGVGCFSANFPFDDLPLPEDPDKIPPNFFIVELNATGNGIVSREVKDAKKVRVDNLIVMTHGFTGSYESTREWNEPLSIGILQHDPTAQILFIDWTKGASMCLNPVTHLYSQPASNTRSIAAASVSFLRANLLFNISRSYCIGFSLGAHVCGFMAKSARQKWGRLTAIDPAAPLFDKVDPVARVDKSDGHFVDVIHTSLMGLNFDIGHVDFYVNSGGLQPGCEKELVPPGTPAWLVGELSAYFACGHYRAPKLFVSTINPTDPKCFETFRFCPCNDGVNATAAAMSCSADQSQILGWEAFRYPNRLGSFCGTTTAVPPFC